MLHGSWLPPLPGFIANKNIAGSLAAVVGIAIVIANLIQKSNQSMVDEYALNQ